MRRGAVSLAAVLLIGALVQGAGPALASAPPNGRDRLLAALERRHEQMVARGRAHPAAPAPAAPTAGEGFPLVRDLQQISSQSVAPEPRSEYDTEVEPDVAMDPNDPNVVVAVMQQGRFSTGGSVDPGWATSHDGGTTWTEGNLPGLTTAVGGRYSRASDPVVAFGPDGAAYANTLTLDLKSCRTGVAVNRSDDGGLTWNAPTFVQQNVTCNNFNDKNWLTVDAVPGSPHEGRLYAVWDQSQKLAAPILLRWSDDRGATWSRLHLVSSRRSQGIDALPLVQPNGDLTVVWDDYTGRDEIVSRTSHDGGLTWDPIVRITALLGSEPPDMRTGGLPTATVDPVTGYLYAGWQDGRFRSDGLNDIVVTRSVDGGRTWSDLVRVNPDATDSELDHFTPDLAAYDHVVHVTYRTRGRPGGVWSDLVDQRYSLSADDAFDFGGELVVGPPSDLRWAAVARGSFLGDYMGLAAAEGVAHAVWNVSSKPDDRRAYHQTTWGATIEV